jgi:soluble lytic murein transglycosylase-like protein
MTYFDQWAGLPVGTLRAIAAQESGFNSACSFRNVCNWAGACGLMQLRKNALADIRRVYGVELNPLEPIQSIVAAAALFRINREYIKRITGKNPDIWALVAAYNGGYQAGIRYMNFQPLAYETKNYLYAFYNNFRTYA